MGSLSLVKYEASHKDEKPNIDEYLTHLWNMSMGEFGDLLDRKLSKYKHICVRLVWSSLPRFDQKGNIISDIKCIRQIIQRIDGNVPTADDVNDYETNAKEALDTVLAMEADEFNVNDLNQTVGVTIAKSLVIWSENERSKQYRDEANQIILERTGGRRSSPKQKKSAEIEYKLASYITS